MSGRARKPSGPLGGLVGPKAEKAVSLALQGGGAHGAYTWGVLDRLLEEERLEVEAISGTSAGAMNAAVFADGMGRGGRAEARRALEAVWRNISQAAQYGPLQPSPFDQSANGWNLDHSATFVAFDLLTRMLSPYQLNPTNYNPLRQVLERSVDFKRLEGCRAVKLFISASNVKTGKVRVFKSGEITPDVLLASACLPTMFQAIEIDGAPYWDGGYSGNPTITPLVRECDSEDTILIQINPVERPGTPRSARDILDRLNEVSFNAVLLKELRMIALLRNLAHPEGDEGARWAHMRIHRVASDVMLTLGSSSKLNAEWAFLTMLRDKGREAADAFLEAHREDLGKRSSLDLDVLLEGV